MGLVLKMLSTVEFEDNPIKKLEIEQNDGDVIHIQNNMFRIEMSTYEFIEFASTIIEGANKLIDQKKL